MIHWKMISNGGKTVCGLLISESSSTFLRSQITCPDCIKIRDGD